MANTDYAQMVKDAMSNFPVDTSSFENLAKSQAALAEKMSAVAIEAAQKSTDLSARWMQDTLAKLSSVTTAKTEPADYAKSVTDFMSASAEAAAEHMAAYAEIAKKVQAETLELMLAAGKDMSEDVTAAARKAGEDMTAAARKATTDFTTAAKSATSTSTNV
ncbi:MAG TPA: Phasin [Rubellimicrobium sp.]|nr:Phasin [Rubellimicrobium sp.]